MRITDSKYMEHINTTLVFCQGDDITPASCFRRVQIADKTYKVKKCSFNESFTGKPTLVFGIKGEHQLPRVEITHWEADSRIRRRSSQNEKRHTQKAKRYPQSATRVGDKKCPGQEFNED